MKIILAAAAALSLAACATTGYAPGATQGATPGALFWNASDGAWVLGEWKDGAYYPGVLKRAGTGRYAVKFDDGTEAMLRPNQIRPYDWQPGTMVACEVVDGRMDPVTLTTLGPGTTDLTVVDEAGSAYSTTTGRCRAL